MHGAHFTFFVRALADGSLTRRGVARGLAGVMAAGLIHSGVDDLDAKKRKKGKKRKRRGQVNDGNEGGGGGGDSGGGNNGGDTGGGDNGGGNQCSGTICNGQCVDLNTDFNNCGACGSVCLDDSAVCAGGRCVNVIGSQGSDDRQFESPSGIAVNGVGLEFVTDTGNERLVLLAGGSFGIADLVRPVGVAANLTSGDIYVTDAAAHVIVRFSASGDLLGSVRRLWLGSGAVE